MADDATITYDGVLVDMICEVDDEVKASQLSTAGVTTQEEALLFLQHLRHLEEMVKHVTDDENSRDDALIEADAAPGTNGASASRSFNPPISTSANSHVDQAAPFTDGESKPMPFSATTNSATTPDMPGYLHGLHCTLCAGTVIGDELQCRRLTTISDDTRLYVTARQCLEDYAEHMPVGTPDTILIMALHKAGVLTYGLTLLYTARSMRFFLTKKGRMGMGPMTLRRGDRVAVLKGGRMPFVLRPVQESVGARFRFLGATYVHGIMDGEAVEHIGQQPEDKHGSQLPVMDSGEEGVSGPKEWDKIFLI